MDVDVARREHCIRTSLPRQRERARGHDPLAHVGARFFALSRCAGGQRFGCNRRHLDAEIDTIEQRARNARAITQHLVRRAAATPARVAEPSTWTPPRCLFATGPYPA